MVFLGYIQDLNEDLPKQDDTAHFGAWLELRLLSTRASKCLWLQSSLSCQSEEQGYQ